MRHIFTLTIQAAAVAACLVAPIALHVWRII